jgi:hypothetical protein
MNPRFLVTGTGRRCCFLSRHRTDILDVDEVQLVDAQVERDAADFLLALE